MLSPCLCAGFFWSVCPPLWQLAVGCQEAQRVEQINWLECRLGGDGRWSPGTGTARERVALAFLYWRPSAVIAEKLWTWKCASNAHAVDLANLESTKQADKVFVPAPGRHNCQNRNTELKTGDASEEREQQQPTDTKRPSGDSAPNPPTVSHHGGLTLCLHPVTTPGSETSFFFFFF